MRKDLIRKLKTGVMALGLAGGLSFGTIKAQTITDYPTTNENIYKFYRQKQDSLHENYCGIEKDIQRRYEQKRDSIYNIYQDYYKKKKGIEDKHNSLIVFLPDSLRNCFRKKADSLDRIFDPEKENLYNNYKQKKDSISNLYKQKVYRDYRGPKEDSILENILEEFFGKYIIEVSYIENSSRDGTITLDSIVSKTPWDFLDPFDYRMIKGYNLIGAWENRELAKWLQTLGKSKRDSIKESILEKEGGVTWGYLWNLRRKLDKNYPKKPVRVPGTDEYYIPQKLKGETISKNALLIFDTIDSTTQDSYKKNIKFKKKKDSTIVWSKDKKNIKYIFGNK